ncbi:iron ABC transporter permease [Pseudomonas sp. HR1]|jgi:iron complex transport system permease protein|uniref:Iron complex transport system permease protein n=3 Tax=Pseudomonas oryzihabitans TaxID=47885 RepID=A0A1G5MZT5_9PSED|nr:MULTISPECIES: iron ABC transporter permease [Pseudomonas]MBH3330441.1 iron ABC transporter permease [Pseudomonas oryzihabitans]MDK4201513.1 iron ABC transporter permease [Pseudomonas sp. HR1]NMY89976.1 iron ABC transporter permease [Pseudomonas psychrotolerans]SCZ29950.1 iron complex transport system permease protein [Pseudomonas psychrotolerans]
MAAEIVWRLGRFSRRLAPATLGRLAVAALVALAALLLCLCLGKVWLTPTQVFAALVERQGGGLGFIVTQLRLPRALLAALVGSALAVSGLLLQGQVRNPLASPDLLGITSGASAGAVFYLAVLAGSLGPHGLPLAAMLGAGLAALLVYGLAWNHGASPLRLVLVGVGVSAMLAAATTFLLVFSPLTTTLSAYVWLTGSVYGASWPEVRALGLWWLVLLLPLAALARHAVLAQLDDDLARGLGVRLQRQRAALLALAVALAGVAIAWGGAIAFVGLIAPHIARRLLPAGFAAQALMAALAGALLVMLADLLGRTLFLPLDLPAGIFVAALGAPFFLYLLIRQRP